MSINIFKQFILGIMLLAVQILVLNNIHLWDCATPLLFVYLIISLPLNTPRSLAVFLGFLVGLISDIFSNTPGVAAAAMTLVGLIQRYWLSLFINRETPEDMNPSIREMGFTKYLFFSFVLVLIFVIAFFTLEEFSFFHWQQWLLSIGGSLVITVILILTLEQIRKG